MKQALIFLTILLGLTQVAWAADPMPAPDFTGVTIEGDTIRLSDLNGQVVLIDFWASWCKPCKEAMPFFIDFYEQHKDDGFVLLSINVDTKTNKMTAFLEKLETKPTFPIIHDPDGAIPPLYELQAMPTTYFVDQTGHIHSAKIGFDESHKTEYEKTLTELLDLSTDESTGDAE